MCHLLRSYVSANNQPAILLWVTHTCIIRNCIKTSYWVFSEVCKFVSGKFIRISLFNFRLQIKGIEHFNRFMGTFSKQNVQTKMLIQTRKNITFHKGNIIC